MVFVRHGINLQMDGLNIDVVSNGATETDVIVDVTYLPKVPTSPTKTFRKRARWIDILAELPQLSSSKATQRSMWCCLVPDWQLAEGLKQCIPMSAFQILVMRTVDGR